MNLQEKLSEYVRACFTGIWIESHEHQDAVTEIAQLCREEGWEMASWDIESGLQSPNQATTEAAADPLAAVRAAGSLSSPDQTNLIVLQNFHRFVNSAEVIQAMNRQILAGKQTRTIMVVLAPIVQLPLELEKLFVVVEHEMPHHQQLEEIAEGIATEEGEFPEGLERERILDAMSGLTRYEAESACSLSLVREGRLSAATLWEQKSQMLKKSGLLQLHRGQDDFTALGGLSALKEFCRRSLAQTSRGNPLKKPKGVLLLGVPGTGKSAFAQALGRETGRPTLILDVGALMGSLLGQTESNVRQALKIADAMQPCILFVDELEKALSGVAGSGQADSGVSARLFGTLLSWMNDHTSDVYLIATCNDISRLPPELSRAERVDAVMFLDLPSREEKDAIWELYLRHFEIPLEQARPADENFTGAEIRACCRLAALLDLPLVEAAQNVIPVATTASESIEKLRSWASGRCLSASQPGVYRYAKASNRKRRSVTRDPSVN